RLASLAAEEKYPEVRLALAECAKHLGSTNDSLPLLHALMRHKEDASDPVVPFMIWLAYEPVVTRNVAPELLWLKEHVAENMLIRDHIIPRVMRRLVATGKPDDLTAGITFLSNVKDTTVRKRALEGLAVALKDRLVDAPANWKATSAELLKNADADT